VATADLLVRARAGDGDAFAQLVDPHRRELHVHCYRILGSAQDAEDALQETLLAAWLGLPGFEGRSSFRTWLYRVATSRCLNTLRSATRRPQVNSLPPRFDTLEPTRLGEVVWLEPYPDILLDELADAAPGPEARYEAREAISLAFITALQLLPPRQRAVLVLRDVLGFHAQEVADILDTTEESVTSALKRARVAIQRRVPTLSDDERSPTPNSAGEHKVLDLLTRAFEDGDVDNIVALLTDDVWLRMPPVPLEYQGRALAARFFGAVMHGRRFRLVATRSNGQPAFGVYLEDPHSHFAHASGLIVLTLAGSRISAVTRFDNSALDRFGLPRTLAE
jgi:RNA polymerase sigma-70 factor, ECF subfamily